MKASSNITEVLVGIWEGEDGHDSNTTSCPVCNYYGLQLNFNEDTAACTICKSKFKIKVMLETITAK